MDVLAFSSRWTGKDAFDFVERVTTADVYGPERGLPTACSKSKLLSRLQLGVSLSD